MTRSEFNARQLTLESRILNASYHASKRGFLERAWLDLYYLSVDELQVLLNERDEELRDNRDYIRLCEARGK